MRIIRFAGDLELVALLKKCVPAPTRAFKYNKATKDNRLLWVLAINISLLVIYFFLDSFKLILFLCF